MRVVLVTGARQWTEDQLVFGALSDQVRLHGPFIIVHGGQAVGVDALAHDWFSIEDPSCDLPCCDPSIQCVMRELEERYPVDIATDEVDAIPKRNQRIVDRGADVCLASIGPDSRSSIDIMTRAHIAGIPVVECHQKGCGSRVGSWGTLCYSDCAHAAIEHDQFGCHVYGSFDTCACAGYTANPRALV